MTMEQAIGQLATSFVGERAAKPSLDISTVPDNPQAYPALDDPQACVLFVHIPKTAGTTLKSILHRYIPLDRTFMTYDHNHPQQRIAELAAMPDEQKRRQRLVCGHTEFGLHRLLIGPYRYITVLRDPMARIRSHYRHVTQHQRHPFHAAVVEQGIGVEEYLTSIQPIELNNGQTRLLSGLEKRDAFGCTSSDLLDRAIENLERHFVWVGLTEQFEQSLLLLAATMGWRFPHYQSGMVSKRDPRSHATDAATIQTWRELNDLDCKLHAYAQERLAKELGMRRGWRARTALFRAMNAGRRCLGNLRRSLVRKAG